MVLIKRFFIEFLFHIKEKKRDVAHGAVFIVVVGSMMALFVWAVFFMARSLNMIVGKMSGSTQKPIAFDMVQFMLVARRLNIPVAFDSIHPTPSPPVTSSALGGSPAPSVTPEQTPHDQKFIPVKSLTVRVLNGTNTTGLAREWKARFAKQGIAVAEIGNMPERNFNNITVRHKPSVSSSLEPITRIIFLEGSEYVLQPAEEESSSFDVTIIVGN